MTLMKRQNRSTGAGSNYTTLERLSRITPGLALRVNPPAIPQACVDPFTADSGIPTDDYCNATAITNWTDEIKRRIAQFEPMTKLLGTSCAG
jgi:hypothetical protein